MSIARFIFYDKYAKSTDMTLKHNTVCYYDVNDNRDNVDECKMR